MFAEYFIMPSVYLHYVLWMFSSVFVILYKNVNRLLFYSTIDTMEAGDFKDFAKAMTDYIAEYLENIRERFVVNTYSIKILRYS